MENITIFDLVITGGVPIGTIAAAWVNMRVTVGGLKQQITYLEKQLEEEKQSNTRNFDSISEDIKGIYGILTEIKVAISKT
jgi:hypothetical protein